MANWEELGRTGKNWEELGFAYVKSYSAHMDLIPVINFNMRLEKGTGLKTTVS